MIYIASAYFIFSSYSKLHTKTQPFYSSLNFVWDNPDELIPEGTFCHLREILVQNEDNTGRCTKNLEGLPPHPD